MKHLFMLNISLKSHLIGHLGTRRAFKDAQRALRHLRHSNVDTWALGGYSEGTRGTRGHFDTRRALRHLKDTRPLGYLRHLGTRTLRALKHLDTWALKALGHSGSQGTWAIGHSGTRGTLFSRLPTQMDHG